VAWKCIKCLISHFSIFSIGPIISAKVLDKTFIIVGDVDVSFELLTKRSLIYSDRPPSVMVDLSGWSGSVNTTPYGPR
jgi:hypothetical protein